MKKKLFLRYRCYCGQPARFLRSWRTLRGSFTKPCTQWGHISSVRDTLWDSWTWPKKRCVEESLEKRNFTFNVIIIMNYRNYICSCTHCSACALILINKCTQRHDFGLFFTRNSSTSGRSNWESRSHTKAPRHLMAEWVQHWACGCKIIPIDQFYADFLNMFLFKTFRKLASTRLLITCWKTKRTLKLSRKYDDAL